MTKIYQNNTRLWLPGWVYANTGENPGGIKYQYQISRYIFLKFQSIPKNQRGDQKMCFSKFN